MRRTLIFRSTSIVAGALMVTLWLPVAAGQRPAAADSAAGLDLSHLDSTCAPCTDFYRFANGRWLARAEIPAAHPMWGAWFELMERTDSVLRGIVEDAMADSAAPSASDRWRIGTFYRSCLDSAGAEAAGLKPLAPLLDRIAGVRTRDELGAAIAELKVQGFGPPFGFWGAEDPKNNDMIIATASQGGLGMPDRDYYTGTDARSRSLRAEYVNHVARMLALAGASRQRARRDAQRIMALETRLARASMPNVEQRNPDSTHHMFSLEQLRVLTPHFDWKRFLVAAGLPEVSAVNVAQPGFFKALDRLLVDDSLDTWKAYLRWHLLAAAAPALGAAFVNEDFRFDRNLTGAKELLPRPRRCLDLVKYGALSQAVGRAYVQEHFAPATKARVQQMVDALRAALGERIRGLDWMSDATKREALAKLESLRTRIGYPEKWWDYSALAIEPGAFAVNFLSTERWQKARNLAKIGKAVDRDQWNAPPHLVDAFVTSNEIFFPAGILRPPFFDPRADDAVNYGAMGATIGHELTHHFDDQGRKFDAAGNLRDWWSPDDATNYRRRAQQIVEQFAVYTVLDSATRVNGELTQGENISDLGGLEIAYDGLQRTLASKGRPPPIAGLTPEQRFFLSWAQEWRQVSRPEHARTRVKTDTHAPWKWRVNGPLANMPEFARAFGCDPGDPMVRGEQLRVQIW